VKIIALDPSLVAFGWSILDSDTNELVDAGCIETHPIKFLPKYKSNIKRLNEITEKLNDLFIKYPDISFGYSEIPVGSKSSSAATALASVQGIIIALFHVHLSLNYEFIMPRDVKKTLTFNQNATKDQLVEVVKNSIPNFRSVVGKTNKVRLYAISDAIAVYLALEKKKI